MEKYRVVRYGQWWYGILNTETAILLRVGPNPNYNGPLDDKENKLLLFKNKEKAQEYIDTNLLEEKLIQSSSDKALQQNIKTEIDSGKSPKQAAAIAYSIQRKNENMNLKENTITGNLPPSIDKFLMDMSQMYIDDLSYNDISKFGDRATEEDIKQLRKYRRELSQGFEEDDPEVKEIFNKIKNLVKGLDESMNLKEELSLSELVKDSINHLVNDLGRDSGAEDFADDVINDIENNYDVDVDFSDPLKYKDWASEIACEVSRQLNNPINEAANQQTVYRVEYYDPKLYKWIKFYETKDIEDAKKQLETPIFGDPEKRIAQYNKSGVRKIKYDFVKKIDEALHGKEEIDEFFKLCNEIGLKTFGDLQRFADDNKNRISVNKLLSEYDSSMSTDAFFETLRDYKKEILSDEDFEYDDPLNVVNKLKRTDESMENKLNKQEVLDWISEHEIAWEDFVNYFEDIYQSSAEVPMDEIVGWISDHDDLAEDFENKFGISVNADVYDDFSEEEIEEHLTIDAYDQLNSPNILEINTTKHNKLKESVEGKWNIGSNKLISTDSQEYANLVDLAKLLQERSPNGYEYRVEKTYEDFGAGMQWYTIICDEKNGWGTHQVLSPREWIYLANTGDVEGTYKEVVSDKYFQDKVKKDRTVSLFKYMDSLED